MKSRVILKFNTVDSTQTISKKIINKLSGSKLTPRYPFVIIARQQKTGYGRFKRKWRSPSGGLWFSIIIAPNSKFSYNNIASVTSLIAKQLRQTLKKQYKINTLIKLPNDIMYNNKKLAGCIVETEKHGTALWAITGIGINVNNPVPENLSQPAISLKSILHKSVNIEKLLDSILQNLLPKII